MTVKIIGGRAGRLLPHILPKIGEASKAGTRVILLVPEQYTLQAEREIIAGLNLPGLLDIEVLSPRRLTRKIRECGGHVRLAPLDAAGRSMAIAQALTLVQDELTYYKRVALTPGLPDKMSVLMADMQRAGLTPEAVAAHAESLQPGALKAKEGDLAKVWSAYLEVIDGRFADETMQQQDVRARLIPAGVVNDAAVFVYGFDVLPGPMIELLCECAKVCESLTVTMTMDAADAPDGRIFLTQRGSAAQLMKRLQEAEIPVEWRYLPIGPSHDARSRAGLRGAMCEQSHPLVGQARPQERASVVPALEYLERNLFNRQAKPCDGSAEGIAIHAAANPYAEAAHIAKTLTAWHEAGMPWQHMAVAMADETSMAGILATTLTAAGIPHYIARKDSALRHGLTRMLLGALRSATGGYAAQDVLHMMKSGFSPLTAEEAHFLENYALENGIDHGRWRKEFTRGDRAEEAEALRVKLITPVETLHDRLKEAKSAAQSVEAVFRLLEDVNAYQTLLHREEELLRRNMGAEAAQNRQMWQLIMDLLDQLHALLGERRAAMKDIARFVTSGLTGASIASLPPQPEAVMIGEAGHLLTGRIDALVLCGMQDGAMASSQDSLITEVERRALAEGHERPIGLTRQETAALRQSDFYRTIALPRKQLLITFAQGSQDGTALRPASLVDDVRRLFPDLVITGGVTADGSDDLPLSPQLALDALAPRLRALADGLVETLEPAWLNALKWLWQSDAWHERTRQVLNAAVAGQPDARLSMEMTRRLFTQDTVSISRLEKFASCPYQHYVDYGLKPVKREAWAFEADDAGDFYHAALQGFAHAALHHPDWPDLPEEEIDAMMEEVLRPLTAQWQDGPLTDTPAARLQGEKYVRTVKRAAWLFTRHAKTSRFRTVGEEVEFGTEDGLPPVVLTLKDGRRIALRGKIDRIDRWDDGDEAYLRVIDYKSARKDIDPTRLYHGLQLQLMLYLQAAAQGMNGNAAGAFYFRVSDPLVEAEDVKSAAEAAIARTLQLKGVVLSEVNVINAMDAEGDALGKIFNKNGSVAAGAGAYSREEMQVLLAHTRQKAADLADGIRAGDIAVSPAQIKDWSACQWCDYASVCGFDPAMPHCTKRVLPHLERQDLLQMMANDNNTSAPDAKDE
ncbi:MAG: PD-(D/E)XK nuclease family protein [Clostridia bacterium]|nr:PD-(D/E)XK nuclease family protein [Clostridia bacterium]